MKFNPLKSFLLGVSIGGVAGRTEADAQQWSGQLVEPPIFVFPTIESPGPAILDTRVMSQQVVTAVKEQQIYFHGPEEWREEILFFSKKVWQELCSKWAGESLTVAPITVSFRRVPPGIDGLALVDFDGERMLPVTLVINPEAKNVLNAIRHELAHVLLRALCGPRIPQWIDEGGAVTAEVRAAFLQYKDHLVHDYLHSGKRIPLDVMFLSDRQLSGSMDLTFYAQAAGLTSWLISIGPQESELARRRCLVQFVRSTIEDGRDVRAHEINLRKYYGISDLGECEQKWREYVEQQEQQQVSFGSPR
jgi:hypothetical protein